MIDRKEIEDTLNEALNAERLTLEMQMQVARKETFWMRAYLAALSNPEICHGEDAADDAEKQAFAAVEKWRGAFAPEREDEDLEDDRDT